MPEALPDYYNRLLEHRRAEYASKGLSRLPPDFLSATTRYLAALRERLEQEVRENPTSKKVEITRTTYQRASASARDVLESRVTKLVQLAAQHVNLGGEPANLLSEERAVYDALVRELASFRRTHAPFLETAGGAAPPPPPASPASPVGATKVAPEPSKAPTASPAAPVARATTSPTPSAAPSPSPSGTVIVRVLADQKPLALSGQGSIELFQEDLAVLPTEQASALLHHRFAERVEPRGSHRVT